ncbi:MAG TPA: nuclear transport factor 2 family protein [Rubrobacter sp.]|jgi:ketosteroid isomerase-like protein|nr:nuclear transport factor 2 family protein [Rubrobacter sp.]
MAEVDDLDEVLEQWQLAVDEFQKGNPKPTQELFSHREDVTLANPLGPAAPEIGPVAHGWEQVARTQEHAASQFTDGQLMSTETVAKYVTAELACVVHIERGKAKVGGREDITPLALRATMIFRPEDGTWKVVHRHADPITTLQPAESVIQE